MPLLGSGKKAKLTVDLSDEPWQETPGDEQGAPPPTMQEEIDGSYPTQSQEPQSPQAAIPEGSDEPVVQIGAAQDSLVPSTRNPDVAAGTPVQRGRQVGDKALALISRFPLVGLKYLRDSAEFVVYDNQPPPSGEYAVQTLGITTLVYNGVQQNHLLVTFKAGLLTGLVQEQTYVELDYGVPASSTDYLIDINAALTRPGKTMVLRFNRDIVIKINSAATNPISLYAATGPFEIGIGLDLVSVYITTTVATKVKLEVY